MSRRKHLLDDLDQDIRTHIEIETRENIERGMPPEEAHFAAVRKFGNVTRVMEDTRGVWTWVWLEQLLQDMRYGLRILRKNPGFTAVAVLTLALGIGANTAIFSVVYAVLLKPLPYPQPDQLYTIFESLPSEGVAFTGMSYPNLEELRAQDSVVRRSGRNAASSTHAPRLWRTDHRRNIHRHARAFLDVSGAAARRAHLLF